MAARDLAAFAFIPPGKKNSRGAWRLRQIEVGYNMLQQVRRGVTERRRAYATPPGRPGGAELISDASGRREIFPDANQVKRYLRVGYPDARPRIGAKSVHLDGAKSASALRTSPDTN